MMEGPQNSLCCTGPTFPVLPRYQHPPRPALALFPSSPRSLCPVPHATGAAHPPHMGTWHCYLHLQGFIPGGEKKEETVSLGKKMPPGTAHQPSISWWDRVSPEAHKEDTGGWRVL